MAEAAAVDAAAAAAKVIAEYLARGEWQTRTKADDSPVTEVDLASEHAIREVLTSRCPGFGFHGEETGRQAARGDDLPRWLVDPIDGTLSFVRRMPFWSIQIALEHQGEIVLGVSTAPLWHEQLVARRGGGSRLNGEHVSTRGEVTTLADAFLSSGNLASLASREDAWARYGNIVRQVRRTRGYGDFCHYHQLVRGQTDLVIESDVNILDIAALSVAVHEAGGVMSDLAGKPVNAHTTSVLAAASRALHEEALDVLAW
ncbi:MAG: inositol-phosphate phosphatase [Gammaproteobacteria bacterium]|nr:MAG: inositol-phosphate phosphatase [Gammaproteobacteria bacterium]PIE36624.1 MAG: inositol-phosphate phosphatase [Gammaproteobacteria bacterium]